MKLQKLKLAQRLLLVVVLSLLSSNFVCNGYQKAGQLSKDFALGVSAFNDAEIEFHKQGKISDEEHKQIQTILLQVETTSKSLDLAITTTHNTSNAREALDVSLTNLQLLFDNGVLHVKNAEVQATLKASVVVLKSILDNILILAGGGK